MLDSWNDGEAKTAILQFIESVTTPGDTYVPSEARVATFDNDGTLWCERPRWVQTEFVMRPRGGGTDGPAQDWVPEVPQRGLSLSRIAGALDRLPDLVAGVADLTRGMTTEDYEAMVSEFFRTAVHPTLGVPFTELAYRPMIELIDLLKAKGFSVYICTGGGRDFVRVISEELYGIPRGHVIGSAGLVEYRDGDIYRKKGIEYPIDDGAGKAVHIWRRTGRKPIFACGNADGDTQMLRISRFRLVIRHDDPEREFAYHDNADKVLAEAEIRGWTIASMKNDFARVF